MLFLLPARLCSLAMVSEKDGLVGLVTSCVVDVLVVVVVVVVFAMKLSITRVNYC